MKTFLFIYTIALCDCSWCCCQDNKELVNVGDFVATSDLTVSPFPHVTPFLLSRYNNLLILGQIWCFADMLQSSTLICSWSSKRAKGGSI